MHLITYSLPQALGKSRTKWKLLSWLATILRKTHNSNQPREGWAIFFKKHHCYYGCRIYVVSLMDSRTSHCDQFAAWSHLSLMLCIFLHCSNLLTGPVVLILAYASSKSFWNFLKTIYLFLVMFSTSFVIVLWFRFAVYIVPINNFTLSRFLWCYFLRTTAIMSKIKNTVYTRV